MVSCHESFIKIKGGQKMKEEKKLIQFVLNTPMLAN
jgi:hypothetical protein